MYIIGRDFDKTTFKVGGNTAGGTIEIHYLRGSKVINATVIRQFIRFRYSIAI